VLFSSWEPPVIQFIAFELDNGSRVAFFRKNQGFSAPTVVVETVSDGCL
jgi:hypothetical protein